MATTKPAHTLILDSGPIIKNDPPVSTLIAQSEALFTTTAVISEIRDAATRSRVETVLLPFLTIRDPRPASVKVVSDFSRKTGDLDVLSRTDVQVLALAFELECERNGGDWRLRKTPGQKGLNGTKPKSPVKSAQQKPKQTSERAANASPSPSATSVEPVTSNEKSTSTSIPPTTEEKVLEETLQLSQITPPTTQTEHPSPPTSTAEPPSTTTDLSSTVTDGPDEVQEDDEDYVPSDESDLDAEGWITPSNISKHRALEVSGPVSTKPSPRPQTLQVATLTTDFPMQNVLLQMNLHLLAPSLHRVKYLKTFILRCHACFLQTKDMSKQFCPRCGKPTLMRVSCSTNAKGEFKIYLKKKMEWHHRGDKFSIPKPVGGSSSGKLNVGGGGKGGGKGGWGRELILAEDQKEYVQAMVGQSRRKERDLMDEDYLPGILTGERGRARGRVKIGGGRNINSRKRI